MKRYIYIMLALVMGATGCKMTDGYDRKPIDVGEYIASEVLSSYKFAMSEAEAAIIADWCLSTEDDQQREKICEFLPYHAYEDYEVSFKNDTVRIFYRYFHRPTNEEQEHSVKRFVTDGKLLSEGGTWKLVNHGQITGNVDDGYCVVADEPSGVILCNLQLSDVELDVDHGVSYDLSGYLNVAYHTSNADKSVYLGYDTEITEPLKRYRSPRFKSGSIHAVCDDKRDGRHDELDIIFTSPSSANVVYLGQQGSISQ
jgi:hypothetical protein